MVCLMHTQMLMQTIVRRVDGVLRPVSHCGGRGYGGGGRGRLYTYRYTVTTKMTCIKMGSDESHFNVSLIVRDKVTNHNF